MIVSCNGQGKFLQKHSIFYILIRHIIQIYLQQTEDFSNEKHKAGFFQWTYRIFSYRYSYLYFAKYISLARLTISFPFVSGVYWEIIRSRFSFANEENIE